MKSSTIYSDKDGVLRVVTVEVPKQPEDWVDDDGYLASLSSPLYATKMGEYRKAIQHCKDTSVPFEDQHAIRTMVMQVIIDRNPKWPQQTLEIKTDTFYSVPEFEYEVQMFKNEKDAAVASGYSHPPQKFARLVSPQQEPNQYCPECKTHDGFKDNVVIEGAVRCYNCGAGREQEPEEQDLRQENQRLREALSRVSNCNDFATAREYAREALQNTKEKSKQV